MVATARKKVVRLVAAALLLGLLLGPVAARAPVMASECPTTGSCGG
jgi:hypothetical protein